MSALSTYAEKAKDKVKEDDNKLVFSYLTLRNMIGFSGMLLPVVLALSPARTQDHYGFEPSISDYFYTRSGDILVLILSVIGVFLFTYTGYNWKERMLTILAAAGALGVAFIPTQSRNCNCEISVHTNSGGIFGNHAGEWLHITCAAVFLLSLALMSLIFFPKSKEPDLKHAGKDARQKKKRNVVYYICGATIIACLIILAIYMIIDPADKTFPFIFTFESIAVEAFALSWITKGQTLWPDGEHYLMKGVREIKRML